MMPRDAWELSFPELISFINIRIKKELDDKRWQAKLCINNAVISMSILSGKKIDFNALFPGLFEAQIEQQYQNQADNVERDMLDKKFVLSRLGIDKRGGNDNG